MKKFNLFLIGTLSLLCSCVNKEYDLNKDLSTDVKIEGNKITLPFGNLKAIPLDSLIDVKDIEVLETTDGAYNITKAAEIDPIEESIDAIEISIDGKSETVEIDFTDAEIKSVEIAAKDIEPATFTVPEISFTELNERLPNLHSTATQNIKTAELDRFFELLENGQASAILPLTIPIKGTFSIEQTGVECKIDEYELPEEVNSIDNITLTTQGDNNAKGTLLKAKINRPNALKGVESNIDFKIDFPKYFVLTKKEDIEQSNKYQLLNDNHTIKVEGLKITEEETFVEFYIEKVVDVDEIINNGKIDYKDSIYYTLDYIVNGNITLNENMKKDDFNFDISFEVKLAFKDLEGTTNDINVDFSPIEMNFNGKFDDLDYITKINFVDFKDNESRFKFSSAIDEALCKDFKLKEGYELKVEFPSQLSFNDALSSYPFKGTKVKYDKEDNAFYINDFAALSGDWELALDRLDLNLEVIDNSAEISVAAKVYVVNNKVETDAIELASTHIKSLSTTLEEISGTKEAKFTMYATELNIEEASVNTERINSTLEETSEFSFEEEVEADIKSIQAIEFTEDIPVTFTLGVDGLNKELDMDVNIEMDVKLPSFLVLNKSTETSDGVNIEINDETLKVKTVYNPKNEKDIIIGLKCSGLNFKGKENWGEDGLTPEIINKKSYLKYDGEISVKGEAYIDGKEFSSKDLDLINDEITLNINYEIGHIVVETFHGKYEGEIDKSEEEIDLDLGDELDFLKDGGHTIELAAPQIEINLNNSVGVPVDVDLIFICRDDNGTEISRIQTPTLKIDAADYDEESGVITPKDTKLFLTSNESLFIGDESYKNYAVPELATLLNDKIPSTIELSIAPKVNTNTVHHINITKPIKFSGDYSVFIPLKFNELNINYKEEMEDLHKDLGDATEKLTNVSLNVNMDVVSTLPLGLKISAECYDIAGNLIEDGIDIEPVAIRAGKGGAINNPDITETVQKVTLVVKSKGRSLSTLDKVVLVVKATSDVTVGAVGLRIDQGVKISNIVIEAKGDIETEL